MDLKRWHDYYRGEAKGRLRLDYREDVKRGRSFLGLSNHYRRLIQNFAAIADTLIMLTRKDVAWQ